jgi:hypothetical protein
VLRRERKKRRRKKERRYGMCNRMSILK